MGSVDRLRYCFGGVVDVLRHWWDRELDRLTHCFGCVIDALHVNSYVV